MTALSCPFCGGQPKLVYRKVFREYFVSCTTKSCQTIQGRIWGGKIDEFQFISLTKEKAIEKWNNTIARTQVELIECVI